MTSPQSKDRTRTKYYLFSFLLPFLIMILIFAMKGIYPFGDVTFMSKDYYQQYTPFFYEFHRKLQSHESLFYSWNAGLGANFFSIYTYYLASPLNLLLIFLPKEMILTYVSFLIVLKTGLMGLTMSHYLRCHFRGTTRTAIIFSFAYAFSGFLAAYNWNVMWMDVLVLTPLVILGEEELFLKNKPCLYAVTLSLSIFSNYYLSIMLCIYLLLYYIVLSIVHGTDSITTLKFFWYSFLSGACAAVLILPEYMALTASHFAGVASPANTELYYKNPFTLISRFFFLSPPETGLGHLPNIYCGMLTLFFLIIYAFLKIPRREKALKLFLALFLFLSFNINAFSFFWHGFNYPDSLPARESWLFIFLILTLACEAAQKLNTLSKKNLMIALAVFGCTVLITAILGRGSGIGKASIILSILFSVSYMGLTYLYHEQRLSLIGSLIVGLLAIELSANMYVTNKRTLSRARYFESDPEYTKLTEYASSLDEASGDLLARTDEVSRRVRNHSMTIGYPSLSLFASPSSYYINRFCLRYGIMFSRVFYLSDGTTPFTAALLGQHYTLVPNGSYYFASDTATLAAESGGSKLYSLDFSLPSGYALHLKDESLFGDPGMEAGYEDLSPAELQNNLMNSFGIKGRLLTDLSNSAWLDAASSTVQFQEDSHLFLYNPKRLVSPLSVSFSDGGMDLSYTADRYRYFLDLGYHMKGTVATIHTGNELSPDLSGLSLYRLDAEKLTKFRSLINSWERLENIEKTSNSLSGQITMESEGRLVLPIPYDKGWSLTVDGAPRDIEVFDGLFISTALSKGQHEIKLIYISPGFYPGLSLSLIALAAMIGSLIFERRLELGRHGVKIG